MCTSPVTIINKKRFFDVTKPEQLVLQVPCGKCSECNQTLSNQYKFRCYHEFLDTTRSGGFAYFDTLTYSSDYLPYVSDFFRIKPELDVPCFNHVHTRNFINALRTRLKRDGYDCRGKLNYFLVSEYGTSDFTVGKTGRVYYNQHLPHYHIVFFVKFPISPLDFSSFVSEYWRYGRTDGYPYRDSSYVLSHNTLYSVNMQSVTYITKYIQKSSKFQHIIDRRILHILDSYKEDFPCSSDYEYKLFREHVFDVVGQFHRNGQFFGISALSTLDLDSLCDSPFVTLPDRDKSVVRIPLPTYYKRHLFYNLVSWDGRKFWQLNFFGNYYFSKRLKVNQSAVKSHLDKLCLTYNCDFDTDKLSYYLVFKRGRFDSFDSISPLSLRHYFHSPTVVYNYSSKLDEYCFGSRFFSTRFLGYPVFPFKSPRSIPDTFCHFVDFIKFFVYFDSYLENQLDTLYKLCLNINHSKDNTFEYRQNIHNLHHYLQLVF